MRLSASALLAAPLAALALTVAAPALAQTAPAPANGVTVADARTWLIGLGGQVAEPEAVPNRAILRVADTLPWTLTFFNCATLCDDVQFAATFTGPVTEAQVTAWNRDNRYVKAIWIAPATAGGPATVVAQYDLLLTETGTDQLTGATGVWLQQLSGLAQALRQGVMAAAP